MPRPPIRLALLLSGLLILLPLPARGAAPDPGSPALLIAAAADLVFAFREITPAFERERGVAVRVTLGSSGNLTQQIQQGAPFDAFFSANRAYVETLAAAGAVRRESLRPYARGILVVAGHADGPPLAELGDLAGDRIRRVAIANPAHAPYGMAAREALERAGLWERVRPKLVYGESIGQAQQFLRTGSVDAALLALSVAMAPEFRHVAVDQGLYRPLVQWAAVTAVSRQPDAAAAFIDFVVGPGRPVLQRFGFLSPGDR
ncbi:MAG: molybdate ABC transporter substrate-binding protein [Candidatus Methylomirabilales bacterium]